MGTGSSRSNDTRCSPSINDFSLLENTIEHHTIAYARNPNFDLFCKINISVLDDLNFCTSLYMYYILVKIYTRELYYIC
jgi:hypothetical protein